jgi:hypothetical protein
MPSAGHHVSLLSVVLLIVILPSAILPIVILPVLFSCISFAIEYHSAELYSGEFHSNAETHSSIWTSADCHMLSVIRLIVILPNVLTRP